MPKSYQPLLWLLFAAGGWLAALITPVLILVTGLLLPLGRVHLSYATLADFAGNPIGKLVLFDAIALPLWHAVHCLRVTAHDLGLSRGVTPLCYGAAGLVVLSLAAALLAV
jgi:succinate dehydrogenase subunit D